MEVVAKSYYKAILTDANAMIDKYMSLVKNFPIVFNGSKVKQTIENLMNQLNKVGGLGLGTIFLVSFFQYLSPKNHAERAAVHLFDVDHRELEDHPSGPSHLHQPDVSGLQRLAIRSDTCKIL